ncbi:anthocyanidin 3-O-glucosyltransferase 5-like [Abrus precatorius]|uniref:Glycosyltransferase n=1 Tax=Abrus precatorius TaxID=3816 RepID=A0A8B8MLQ8_ABRPR|nr:anthocyanidin 3-O-glucosyltransferase 5-like [Abrus precatorius]
MGTVGNGYGNGNGNGNAAIKCDIVVLPSPGIGHVTPLLELSKLLVTHHNFHVTFLNITTEASTVQNRILHSPDLPPNIHVIDLPPVDLSLVVNDQTPVLTRVCLNLQENIRNINALLKQLPNTPQALIIDLFGTQALDQIPNIPIFTFFTPSAHLLALSLFLPQLDRDVEGEFVDLPEPVQVPGCKPIRTEDLLDQITSRKNDEYKWYFYHVSRVPMSAGILMNTWQDLEPVTFKALREDSFYRNIPIPPVYPIGPVIKEYEPVTETVTECLGWLDNQPAGSVLFVSFGSGGVLSMEQQTELAWGLELSGQRFVWVVRVPNDANASAAFFNNGGDVADTTSYLPEGFVERTRERGMVVMSWTSQVAILRHASTGAFLSHCGWNSTLESVANGVPMIAWPLYAEQKMNATMVDEDLGVAVKVKCGGGVVGRKEIERVVRMVIEGEEGKRMKQRARELKKSAKKALEVGGASYEARAAVAKACMFTRNTVCTEKLLKR